MKARPPLPGAHSMLGIAFAISWMGLSAADFTPSPIEVEITELIVNHPEQRRSNIVIDPTLGYLARQKALDLGTRDYWAHVDPDGFGPNRLVQLAGIQLPANWGTSLTSNFIESLGAAVEDAEVIFQAWLDSPSHRSHVLAEHDFYAYQTRIGVGAAHVPGSQYGHYYVFLSIPELPDNPTQLEPYTVWKLQHFTLPQLQVSTDGTDHDHDSLSRAAEFVFDFDPWKKETLPPVILNRDNQRLEWHLPVRDDLGSMPFVVETSSDLLDWSEEGVLVEPRRFSIPLAPPAGFLRYRIPSGE